MNLRTLKKLSKRAAPLLILLGDRREQFPCPRGDGHVGGLITARKHWDRSGCHPSFEPWNNYLTPKGMPLKHVTRAGRSIVIRPPDTPRKGTVMVGGMDGGEQPEWSEETAWEALTEQVWWHFTEWDAALQDLVPTRTFRAPRDYLRAAVEITAGGGRQEAQP